MISSLSYVARRACSKASSARVISNHPRNMMDEMLQAVGKSRVVLVSDRLHLPRAARLFRRAGLDVVGVAGVPASSMRRAFGAVLYETASLMRGLFRRRR